MTIFTTTSLALALFTGSLGLFVLGKNFRSPANLTFALGMFSITLIAIGDLLTVSTSFGDLNWQKVALLGAALFPGAWLMFSISFGRSSGLSLSRLILPMLATALLAAIVGLSPIYRLVYAPEFMEEGTLYVEPLGYYYCLVVVVLSITAIVRMESLLWSVKGGTRWNIKYAVIGVGGLLGMFIYFYSYPVLYRIINLNLAATRNAVFLTSSIVLAGAFVRQRFLDVEIFISRRVVFKSASLFVVGLYFIFLGIIGEGLRFIDKDISRNVILFFAFAGISGFSALFLAEGFRRKAKRIITDNFYRHRYEYKDEWLKFTSKLSKAHSLENVLDETIEIMADTFGVKGVDYYHYDQEGGFITLGRTNRGTETYTQVLGESLSRLIRIGAIYDRKRPEAAIERTDGDFFDRVRSWVLIPVISSEKVLGLITLGQSISGITYDDEDYELMVTLSRQAAYAIEKTTLADELAEAREMEAMGKVTSFVMHDLKNTTSSLSLLLDNAEKFIDRPDFQQDMVRTVKSTVTRMTHVMRKLSGLRESENLKFQPVLLNKVMQEVLSGMAIPQGIRLDYQAPELPAVRADDEEIRKVLVNLILNAIEATGGKGDLSIAMAVEGDHICVKISDSGPGMPQDFLRNRLFKPFQTTKKGGLGIGLYHCQSIIQGHGSRIEVQSEEGRGATFSFTLPVIA